MKYNMEYALNGCRGQFTYKRLSTLYKKIKELGIKKYVIASYNDMYGTYDKQAYMVLERSDEKVKHSSEYW